MKPRSIADELLAAGALEEREGHLRMTSRGYVPGADPVEHVLSDFSPSEEERLPERIGFAVEALEALLREGAPAAMNRFNRAVEPEGETPPEPGSAAPA